MSTNNSYNLNDKQKEAVDSVIGPLLIIAGPGSGKTHTLVERVINLIQNHNAKPENLLVVTFTDKAARELKTRISNRVIELDLDFHMNDMYLGTFHQICLRILQEYRQYSELGKNYSIIDQFDQQYLIAQNMYRFKKIEGVESVAGEGTNWMMASNILRYVNSFKD